MLLGLSLSPTLAPAEPINLDPSLNGKVSVWKKFLLLEEALIAIAPDRKDLKLAGNLLGSNLKASIFVKDQPAGEVLYRLADTLDLEWEKKGEVWYLRAGESHAAEKAANQAYLNEYANSATTALRKLRDLIPLNELEFAAKKSAANQAEPAFEIIDDSQIIAIAEYCRREGIPAKAIADLAESARSRRDGGVTVRLKNAAIQTGINTMGAAMFRVLAPKADGFSLFAMPLLADSTPEVFYNPSPSYFEWVKPAPTSYLQSLKKRPFEPADRDQLTSSDFAEHVAERSGLPVLLDASRQLVSEDNLGDPWKTLSDVAAEKYDGKWLQFRPGNPLTAHAGDPDEKAFRAFTALQHPAPEDIASFFTKLNMLQRAAFDMGHSYSRYLNQENYAAFPALRFWLQLSSEERRKALTLTPLAFPGLNGRQKGEFERALSFPSFGDMPNPAAVLSPLESCVFALNMDATVNFRARHRNAVVKGSFDQMTEAEKQQLRSAKEITYTFYFGLSPKDATSYVLTLPAPKPEPIPPSNLRPDGSKHREAKS